MKKPVNRWAIAMWVAAAIYAVMMVLQLIGLNYATARESPSWLFNFLCETFEHSALWVGMLAGLGALIELVDQVRWIVLRGATDPKL